MRQAGRSLPEYRALRGTGSILEAIGDPSLACEVTMQPVRRYGVDAAILFSDIVVPYHAIGFGVDVVPGRGPVIKQPFAESSDLGRLRDLNDADVLHVTQTVDLVVKELEATNTPLIGFAGAPFTVASYLVEGAPTRDFAVIKSLMHRDPILFDHLLDRLVAITVSFLRAQVAHGARALQLFDSWAGSLSRDEYERFALRATQEVLEGIADLDVPTILFGVGTGELLDLMASAGSDVVGIDWHVDLDTGRRRVGDKASCRGISIRRVVSQGRSLGGSKPPARCSKKPADRRTHIQSRSWRASPDRSDVPRSSRSRRARRRTSGSSMKSASSSWPTARQRTPDDVEAYYTRIRHGRAPTPGAPRGPRSPL